MCRSQLNEKMNVIGRPANAMRVAVEAVSDSTQIAMEIRERHSGAMHGSRPFVANMR